MRTGKGYVKVRTPMRFGSVLVAIAGGAALTAGSAAITWASGTGNDELRGPLDITATGGEVAPALVPVAAAAIAALGALLAAKGVLRRGVGGVTLLLGVVVCWLGIRGFLHEPAEVLFGSTSSVRLADVRIRPLGPLVATLGGLALVVAGFAVLTGRIRTRGLGARHERAGGSSAATPTSTDAALEMWKDLDDDRDPTLDPPAPAARDRVDRTSEGGSSRVEPSS